MPVETSGLERAIQIACTAHEGQLYPSPEPEPFILHPLRVMLAVGGAVARTAAVLHDVLEDSDMTVEQLRAEPLASEAVDAVVVLTRRPGVVYEDYIEQIALHPLARRVKSADLADNLANNRRLPTTRDVEMRITRYERALRRLGR